MKILKSSKLQFCLSDTVPSLSANDIVPRGTPYKQSQIDGTAIIQKPNIEPKACRVNNYLCIDHTNRPTIIDSRSTPYRKPSSVNARPVDGSEWKPILVRSSCYYIDSMTEDVY